MTEISITHCLSEVLRYLEKINVVKSLLPSDPAELARRVRKALETYYNQKQCFRLSLSTGTVSFHTTKFEAEISQNIATEAYQNGMIDCIVMPETSGDFVTFLTYYEKHALVKELNGEVNEQQSDWQPLKEIIGDVFLHEFMFMGTVDEKGTKVFRYKHIDSRVYVNLDKMGNFYRYSGKENYISLPPVAEISSLKRLLKHNPLLDEEQAPWLDDR